MDKQKLNNELMDACNKDDIRKVKDLLSQGADIDSDIKQGTTTMTLTVLMYACRYNKPEMAKLFIANGADINKKDNSGWNSLMHASFWGYPEIVKILIEHGASLDEKNNKEESALLLICKQLYNQSEEAGMLLIEKGCNIHTKEAEGNTPIILASKNEKQRLSKLLIEKGANVNVKNNVGDNALIFCGCNPANKALFKATETGDINKMSEAIKQGAMINAKDQIEETPLIAASYRGNVEVIKFLIQNGAFIEAEDKNGNTALTLALKDNDKAIADILISAGAVNPVVEKEYTYKDDKSNKFWNIEIAKKYFTVTFGKIGTKGQSQTKEFSTKEECQKEANNLTNEKIKKGYVEKPHTSATEFNPEVRLKKKMILLELLKEYKNNKKLFVFDWDNISLKEKKIFLEIFFDCEETDFTDLDFFIHKDFSYNKEKNKDCKWIPFAFIVNYQEEDQNNSIDDFTGGETEVLLVNLAEIEEHSIPVYEIEIDGTAIPEEKPHKYKSLETYLKKRN